MKAQRHHHTTLAAPVLWLAVGCLALAASADAQPIVDLLSDTALPRSARLDIFGVGFGPEQGSSQVLIDSVPAIVTTWTSTEIHAYVPEAASSGLDAVEVVTDSGVSNAATLEVTSRQADGRVRWRMRLDAISGQFSAVAADGTIYASDSGHLYALSPDGGLLWAHDGAGGRRPISLGPDGTIYTGGELIKAINPDGSLRWQFANPYPGLSLLAGPNVGPDGNVYAIQDTALSGDGLGVFSLDPDGNLRWTSTQIISFSGSNSAIVFGGDRFTAGVKLNGGSRPAIWTFDLQSGDELWNSLDLGLTGSGFPVLDPQQRVIWLWGQVGLQAITPQGGVDWSTPHPSAGLVVRPTVGSNGTIYAGDWLGLDLWAVNADGSMRWIQPSQSGESLSHLAIGPDDSVLFIAGDGDFEGPGWVRGYDPTNGTFLWQTGLPFENDAYQFVHSIDQTFSADSETVYFTTRFGADAADGYLYAIATGQPPVDCDWDLDADGKVDPFDVNFVLARFGCVVGGGDPDCDRADVDGDGKVDPFDSNAVLANFGPCP